MAAPALLAALALHILLLLALVLAVRAPRPPTAQPIVLSFAAPLLTDSTRLKSSFAPGSSRRSATRLAAGPRTPLPATAPGPAAPPSRAVLTPLAGAYRDGSPGASAPARGGTPEAGGGREGDGNDSALRALAAIFSCYSGGAAALEPAARARCDAGRLAQARAAPHVDGIPAAKRAYYDGVVAAQDAARDWRTVGPTYDPRANRGPSGARSHGADAAISYACEIKFGVDAKRANRRAGVKWGLPPCPPHLPLNPITAEMRVTAPDTLRDREDDARSSARFDPPSDRAPRP